ncbi:hypothetical protein SAMN05216228_106713 [Rhizobium tibeticum]|uniref:Uncharacterized protein n=1 Tax=Rhizobium tibeticum TaxID=501024 RepID=A0A1H8WKQ0_9HYPH|nr:hypothetical protein RTCCBAU85039_6607 [Rhizobium tibeticum]SEP28027.1 hypothetical protein SAMN05216228_106713 [Rhizobium tibeticum]
MDFMSVTFVFSWSNATHRVRWPCRKFDKTILAARSQYGQASYWAETLPFFELALLLRLKLKR